MAYLFMDMNNVKAPLSAYMLSAPASTWKGYNSVPTAPSTVQATFDTQLNKWIAWSGWTGQEAGIITADISATSGGNDAYGNPIVAYAFQTTRVPAGTISGGSAWFVWLISTGATGGFKQSTIKYGLTSSVTTNVSMSSTYYNLLINYSGSTNIPAGTYRLYSSYSNTNFQLSPGANDYYFQGGTLI